MSEPLAPVTAADILEAAANRVDKAWCQGAYGDYLTDDDPLCLAAALMWARLHFDCAIGPDTPGFAAMSAVDRHLDYNTEPWNDSEGRTKAEVVQLLRDLAKDLRGGED